MVWADDNDYDGHDYGDDDCEVDVDDGRLLPGEEDGGSPFHLHDNEGIVRRPCVLPSYANLDGSCLGQDIINNILIIKTFQDTASTKLNAMCWWIL